MDKYDEAIAWLTEHPDQIQAAWWPPDGDEILATQQAHCLFQTTAPRPLGAKPCGCLTEIRCAPHLFTGPSPSLHDQIAGDNRIPKAFDEIGAEHLPVFAEWQRRLDKELGR